MVVQGLSQRRVVAVSVRGNSDTRLGSGYVVGPRIVLTAGHVAPQDADAVEVRFIGDERAWTGTVVWSRLGGVEDIDAALIRLDGPDLPEWICHAEPVRFGRFVTGDGSMIAEAQGFPRVQQQRDGQREVEPLRGHVPCGAGAVKGKSHIVIEGPTPRTRSGSTWNGMSGAAVWMNDLLVGVVSAEPVAWAGGRVTFQTVERLSTDADFVRIVAGGVFAMDAVELVALAPRPVPGTAGSPAQLLRAESQVVDFHGRGTELEKLQRWCSGAGASVMLVHAQGGQGKTRLALELLARQSALGWVCGVARADFELMATALACEEVQRALRRSTVPVLIMIDYAEAWRSTAERSDDPVRRLLRLVAARSRDLGPIRILLVARSPGTWWAELRGRLSELSFDELTLGRLAVALDIRLRLYREALTALASRLTDLPGFRGTDWSRRAGRIDVPEELSRPRFGHALTLYEQALADLLQSGPHPVRTERPDSTEDILLLHESQYWRRTAEAHDLERVPEVLRESVAAVTLFGASTRRQAENLMNSLPALRAKDSTYRARVTRWLAELYPDPYTAWGPLEPDRLGEFLVATVWGDNDDLVTLVQPHLLPDPAHRDPSSRLSDGQIHRMLIVLDRAAQRRDHLRGIQRTVFFLREAGRTLPGRPEHERHEYLRLGAQKARVPERYVDRIAAGFRSGALWRSRWAWWNAQRRASKVFPVYGEIHVDIVEIDGRTGILAVSTFTATIHDPETGQEWDHLDRGSTSTEITAAASAVLGGVLYIALGLENGVVEVCRRAHGVDGWSGLRMSPPTAVSPVGSNVLCLVLAEIRGAPRAVSSERGGAMTVWDLDSGTPLAVLPNPVMGPLGGAEDMVVAERPDGPVLVTAHNSRAGIRLFDLLRFDLITTYEFSACALAPLPTTDGPDTSEWRILTGGSNGTLEIIDLVAGTVIGSMAGHSKAVTSVRVELGGDLPLAVTTGDDRKVITWDLRTGDQLGTAYVGHTDRVRALTTGRLGRDLVAVTGGNDYTVRVWDLADVNLPEAALTGHTDMITAVTVASGNGRRIGVTASTDLTVRVWDLDAGGRAGADGLPDLYRTFGAVTALAATVHNDDVHVVAGDIDGRLSTLAPALRLTERAAWLPHQVVGLDCRALDGRVLAAAGDNSGAVQGWDTTTGAALGPVTECGGPARVVKLAAPHGRPVAVVATDKFCVTVDLMDGKLDAHAYGGGFHHDHVIGLAMLGERPAVIVTEQGPRSDEWIVRVTDLRTRGQVGADLRFPAKMRFAEVYGSVDRHGEHVVLAVGTDQEVWLRSLSADSRIRPVAVIGSGSPGERRAPVALTHYGGAPAILSGGDNGELELSDARTGVPVVDTEPVNPVAVTVSRVGGRPAAVVASGSRKLVFRELRKGERVEAAVTAPPLVTTLRTIDLGGCDVVFATSALGVRAWNAQTMASLSLSPHDQPRGRVDATTVPVGDDVVVVTARDDKLSASLMRTGAAYGPGIANLGANGSAKRLALAACVFRGRPIVFTAAMLGSTVRMWDLATGEPTGVTVEMAAIWALLVGTVGGGVDVLYVIDVTGLIAEWPLESLRHRPFRRFLGAPRPRRIVDGGGQVGAALIHPDLGLIVASGSAVRLRPFDEADPLPIHLDAPVTGLALGDHGSVVVNTEQGVVLLDQMLSVSPRRGSAV